MLSAIYGENYHISMKKLIFQKIFKDVIVFFIVLSLSLSVIVWVIQAVNFLDYISEDGHGFKVYFSYTLLNFPKIFTRLFLVTLFISVIYIIIRYEENNELILFWIVGISKKQFVKNIIKFSIFFMIIQIIFSAIITPETQNGARSYIRSSNIDFFPSLITEKKFVDTVSNLTIYIDRFDKRKKIMKNIFIKEQSGGTEKFQIILAREGELVSLNNKTFISLKDGEIYNDDQNNSNSFKFENFNLDLSGFTTKTTTIPKIQETKTIILAKCFLNNAHEKKFIIDQKKFVCDKGIKNVSEELLKRLYLPLYLPIITLIGCLMILKTKEEKSYGRYKISIFLVGFFVIFFSEASLKYVGTNLIANYLFFLLPLVIFLSIYTLFLQNLNFKNEVNNV